MSEIATAMAEIRTMLREHASHRVPCGSCTICVGDDDASALGKQLRLLERLKAAS